MNHAIGAQGACELPPMGVSVPESIATCNEATTQLAAQESKHFGIFFRNLKTKSVTELSVYPAEEVSLEINASGRPGLLKVLEIRPGMINDLYQEHAEYLEKVFKPQGKLQNDVVCSFHVKARGEWSISKRVSLGEDPVPIKNGKGKGNQKKNIPCSLITDALGF